MSEHEHDPQADEKIEDMDVPEGESEEVKGGSLNFTRTGLQANKISPTSLKLDVNQLGDGSV